VLTVATTTAPPLAEPTRKALIYMASTPALTAAEPTRTPAQSRGSTDPEHLAAALAAAQAGNQHAFGTLYHDLQPRLLRQLRPLVGYHDAPDVASDTWLHIITGIDTFRGSYRNFRNWATTIAQRRAADHLRRTPPGEWANPTDLPENTAPDNTERDALETLATAAILTLINVLPQEQRKIIMLRVILGLDTPTTAQILGKRPGAIRTGAHRALHTLATRLPHSPTAIGITPSRSQPGRDLNGTQDG
jgi:RNA polymerase sigma-70 factor, ECF subfamily